MVSEDHLLGTEKPFLRTSAVDEYGLHRKFNFKFNDSNLAENHHFPMHDELASKGNVEYVAGGANENKVKAPQPKLQIPGSSSLMGFIGKDRSGKEKKKNVKAGGVYVRYEDENAPISTCVVSVVGNEGCFITNLPEAKNNKSDDQKNQKIWKLGLHDSTNSSEKSALQRRSSKTELAVEDESMKRFLKGSRAFHESQLVSESLIGAYYNPTSSPDQPLEKTELSTNYSLSHRILAVELPPPSSYFHLWRSSATSLMPEWDIYFEEF